MPSPIENLDRVNVLRSEVSSHWLCASLDEKPDAYVVTFPRGYRIDGMRSVKTGGKAASLQRLLDSLARYDAREWFDQ